MDDRGSPFRGPGWGAAVLPAGTAVSVPAAVPPRQPALPLRIGPAGRTLAASPEQEVLDLVRAVLFTVPGERANRPDFGSPLHGLVFQPAYDVLATATRVLVQAALERWLSGRIVLREVSVAVDASTVGVTVSYLRLDTGQERTAVLRRPGGGS